MCDSDRRSRPQAQEAYPRLQDRGCTRPDAYLLQGVRVAARTPFAFLRSRPGLLKALSRLAFICFNELIRFKYHLSGSPHFPINFLGSIFASRGEVLRPARSGCVCSHSPLAIWSEIIFQVFPPGQLVSGLMQLTMMPAAERNRELITDFETQRARLG